MKTEKRIALSIFIIASAVFVLMGSAQSEEGSAQLQLKVYSIDRSVSAEAKECIDCHTKESKGIAADWASSRHAHANVTCLDCHGAGAADNDVSKEHLQYDKTKISGIVSPKDCSRCHPSEAAQYNKSKHAHTLEIIWKIDPWLKDGQNNEIERITGCYHCH
ncbi:MAG: multiheme c-type cytochrome, partial [Planctomycetota bacterium]